VLPADLKNYPHKQRDAHGWALLVLEGLFLGVMLGLAFLANW
jgi:hypothetical protein